MNSFWEAFSSMTIVGDETDTAIYVQFDYQRITASIFFSGIWRAILRHSRQFVYMQIRIEELDKIFSRPAQN